MNSLEALALMQLHDVAQYNDRASVNEWAHVLAEFPLFADVSKRRLRKLVRSGTVAEFAPGQTFVSSGSLYVILGGAAKTVEKPARELGVGDYFGELSLIEDAPRSATVVATQELHVMRLPARSVARLARQEPGMTLTILRNLSRQLRYA